MIDFKCLKTTDVVYEGFLASYEEDMKFFNRQISLMTLDLLYVDKIIAFPVDLFLSPPENVFLSHVVLNCFESLILRATRIESDSNSKSRTIKEFRKRAILNIKAEYRAEFEKVSIEVCSDEKVSAVFKKARLLRDKCIAHLDRQQPSWSENALLTLEEAKALRDAIQNQLDVLSIGVEYKFMPIAYEVKGLNQNIDIDYFLDSVAYRSDIVNMPERDPIAWEYFRLSRDARTLSYIDQFRRKFGLPSACFC